MTWSVRCPAKVNLFLSVAPPDSSGYHPIRTVFQAIGLFDTLTLSDDVDETRVECDWPGLPAENTLTKALRLIRELVELPPLRIRLQKSIPAESGLGGGSSDAAGLLRVVRRIVGGDLPWGEAEQVAAAIGADVPFFLVGGRAKGEGYGEILTPLDDLPQEWLLIVRPDVGVSTAEAYGRLDRSPRDWLPFPSDPRSLHNDFEGVAPHESLEWIERLKSAGADGALLCGSGSAVFGRFPTRAAAEAAQSSLSPTSSWVASMLTRKESLWMS